MLYNDDRKKITPLVLGYFHVRYDNFIKSKSGLKVFLKFVPKGYSKLLVMLNKVRELKKLKQLVFKYKLNLSEEVSEEMDKLNYKATIKHIIEDLEVYWDTFLKSKNYKKFIVKKRFEFLRTVAEPKPYNVYDYLLNRLDIRDDRITLWDVSFIKALDSDSNQWKIIKDNDKFVCSITHNQFNFEGSGLKFMKTKHLLPFKLETCLQCLFRDDDTPFRLTDSLSSFRSEVITKLEATTALELNSIINRDTISISKGLIKDREFYGPMATTRDSNGSIIIVKKSSCAKHLAGKAINCTSYGAIILTPGKHIHGTYVSQLYATDIDIILSQEFAATLFHRKAQIFYDKCIKLLNSNDKEGSSLTLDSLRDNPEIVLEPCTF